MSDKYEFPPHPTFYDNELFPWTPFKSNGGTGDWNEPAPAGTAPPTPKPVAPKLCPFRRKIYVMAGNQDGVFNTYLSKAEYFEEEFQPCLREQCAAWNERMEACAH